MHDENENIRREVLGDIAADLIDELARRKTENVNPEVMEDFRDFIEEADPDQLQLMNLAQMFMEIAIATNEKRLAYASCAVLALSGVLNGMIPEGDWTAAMDYAEYVWQETKSSFDELVSDQVTKLIEE